MFTKGHTINIGRPSWNKGKKCPQISRSCMGRKSWNKGIKMTEEAKQKMILAQKGRHHSPKTEFKKGECSGSKHINWKGGRVKIKGYWHIYCPTHPSCKSRPYVLEHRIIMEKKLGRYLLPTESVHHIDGNPQNNKIKNLKVFVSESEHQKYHRSISRAY